MASRKLLAPRTAVYQDGRGSEPMMDVGRVFPADALNILVKSFSIAARGALQVNVLASAAAPLRERRGMASCRRSRILACSPGVAPGVLGEHAETDAPIKAHGSMGVYKAPRDVDALPTRPQAHTLPASRLTLAHAQTAATTGSFPHADHPHHGRLGGVDRRGGA